MCTISTGIHNLDLHDRVMHHKRPWDMSLQTKTTSLYYDACQECGMPVSTRLHICPMCHARVRRERDA